MVITPDATLDCVGQGVTPCRDLRLKGVNRGRSVGSGLRSNYFAGDCPQPDAEPALSVCMD